MVQSDQAGTGDMNRGGVGMHACLEVGVDGCGFVWVGAPFSNTPREYNIIRRMRC